AVDQDERAVRAEAAQVDPSRAIAAVIDLRVDRVALRGQLLQDLADVGDAGGLELLAVDDRDRCRRGQLLALDQRAGDRDDLFGRAASLVLGELGELLVGEVRSRRDGWLIWRWWWRGW